MNRRNLIAVDLPNMEGNAKDARMPPMSLGAIRSKVEGIVHSPNLEMAVFVSQGFLNRKNPSDRRQLLHQVEKLKAELCVTPGSSGYLDPVDVAMMQYCRAKASELHSLVVASSDADFVPMITEVRRAGVLVHLVFYASPSRRLLDAVDCKHQIGVNPPGVRKCHRQC